jgi:primosomal protein N' (replication factor Y)
LHGVTGSGKTEIYIQLIKEQLEQNKQVLYLLPEIAITPQITLRLQAVFGDKVGVYHSKFNDNERIEIWQKTQTKEYLLILGVRSSIFLPFSDLGLVIIDEEHETTYKQYNPAPRYNARDTSIILASLFDAKTLLGTATPSIETYYNCKTNKYGLVELNTRYGKSVMPEIIIYNIKEARRKKQMKSMFSPLLIDEINFSLEKQKQIILFQNRRGFAPFLECKECGWVPYCENCDVSLTYHKRKNYLICHYCGYTQNVPTRCNACGSTNTSTIGVGTEKIEDEINLIFPNAISERMDVDTTGKKNAHEKIIKNFQNGNVNILIGTQMISKGLDFKNVELVGIINADEMINFPDFRAYERAYHLLTQVSGRAGRSNEKGKVIIQTSTPENILFKFIKNNDYKNFYKTELPDRQKFKYPPFFKLIKLQIKHKKYELTETASTILANELKNVFGELVLGPEDALIPRIKNFYIREILIKIPLIYLTYSIPETLFPQLLSQRE